jgi:beta-glucosidase
MLSINIADVIAVLQTMIPQLVIIIAALVAAIVIAIVVTVKVKQKPKKKVIRKTTWIAFFAILVITLNTIVLGPVYSMVNMAMGGGKISDESSQHAKEVATQIA